MAVTPPATLTVYWCPQCQQQLNGPRKPSRQPHLKGSGYCPGQWQALTYVLAPPTTEEV